MFKFYINRSNFKIFCNQGNIFSLLKSNKPINSFFNINKEKKPESDNQANPKPKQEGKSKQAANKEDKKKAASPKEEKKDDTPSKDSVEKKPAEKVEVKQPEKVEVKQPEKVEVQQPQKIEVKMPQPAEGKQKTVNISNIDYYKSLLSKLNQDWQSISTEKQNNNKNEIAEELLPNQRKFVELMASKLIQMNYYQISHVLNECNNRLGGIKRVAPLGYSQEWENLQNQLGEDLSGEAQFTQFEEVMKDMSKWYQTQLPGFGIGVASSAPAAKDVKEEKTEAKVEEKKEKEMYDIELTSFDSAKKINIIKEVRSILNLGLKESKELVEKAPCLLMRGVKKTEAEGIVKKLSDSGAMLTLK